MDTGFNLTAQGVFEYPVMSERERKTCVDYVIRACLGEVDIDYEMSGEWVAEPPRVIIRSRRKSYNKVKQVLKKLYTIGWVTSYTVRPNGYIKVVWFKDYILMEREPAFRRMAHITGYGEVREEDMEAEYLRDQIFLASNKYLREVPSYDRQHS